ncbi:MAG: 2-oxo acid dehydrogenase subunit E2 [Sedimentisphaerales bacterium]|nr:2-oxo acid dehydrogenase subunit E2 [Sedimentisphaerales bacterium]
MATEVKIPIPDQTTEEVRVVKWHKNVGDAVNTGDVVLEVETDKSVIEVEAIANGVLLAQLFAEDDMVPVGNVVGFVGKEGEKVDAPAKAATPASAAPAAAASQVAAADTKLPEGAVEVKIPIPDQTTEQVRVVKWHKSVGDAVKDGDVVLEVETDKSVIEVEAVGSGTLLAQGPAEDDMVPVGAVVGVIGPEGAKVSLSSASAASPAPTPAAAPAPAPVVAPAPAPVAAPDDSRVKASPIARKVAAKLGVNLTQVKGTGPKGRIVKDDVERFAAGSGAAAPAASVAAVVRAKIVDGRVWASPCAKRVAKELGVDLQQVAGTGGNGRITSADVKQAAAQGTARPGAAVASVAVAVPAIPTGPAPGQPQPGTEVPVTKMRRAIAMNLQMSSRDTPHFNAVISINMSRALAFRTKINQNVDKGQKVSVNDLVVKACAVALTQYPAVNSRWCDDTTIKYMPNINIGVATAVPDGLVVPVLTDADKRDWYDMAAENKRLAGSARQGKIINAGKGTFTVSNLGMYGIDQFTGIINPPEAAILTVGATKQEVVAVDGMIGIQPIMKVTLCSDHRIIDGALAAEFLRTIKLYLEEQIG